MQHLFKATKSKETRFFKRMSSEIPPKGMEPFRMFIGFLMAGMLFPVLSLGWYYCDYLTETLKQKRAIQERSVKKIDYVEEKVSRIEKLIEQVIKTTKTVEETTKSIEECIRKMKNNQ